MHRWGEEDVDWTGIDESCLDIVKFISFWSHIQILDFKEKWGMVRVSCTYPENLWQKYIYRMAYKRAVKKRPHLRKEILADADWDEFLQGL